MSYNAADDIADINLIRRDVQMRMLMFGNVEVASQIDPLTGLPISR